MVTQLYTLTFSPATFTKMSLIVEARLIATGKRGSSPFRLSQNATVCSCRPSLQSSDEQAALKKRVAEQLRSRLSQLNLER